MRKTKSASSYTNKWLSNNKRFWYEKFIAGHKIIIIKKADAPKIVVKRIKEINKKRLVSNDYRNLYNCLSNLLDKKKTSIKDV